MTYKLTQAGQIRYDFDGGYTIMGADSPEYLAWLSEGNTPEPADPVPNPRIAEIQAELTLIDQKSIRAIREGDSARVAQWEAQAQVLRSELASL